MSWHQTNTLSPSKTCSKTHLLANSRKSNGSLSKKSASQFLKCSNVSHLSNQTEFSEKPLHSASIAQVHEAYLKTGEKVAVKVQHEWLREESGLDVMVCELFANLGKKMFEGFDYDFLIRDMKNNVPQELDFRIEARNAIEIKRLFQDEPNVKVPKIYQDLSGVSCSCNSLQTKVLTMEFVTGINIDDREKMLENGINIKEASNLLAESFARQIFEFGVSNRLSLVRPC